MNTLLDQANSRVEDSFLLFQKSIRNAILIIGFIRKFLFGADPVLRVL